MGGDSHRWGKKVARTEIFDYAQNRCYCRDRIEFTLASRLPCPTVSASFFSYSRADGLVWKDLGVIDHRYISGDFDL